MNNSYHNTNQLQGEQLAKAETERITRNNDLKKIEGLFNKLKEEKKRIKKLLK